jgi:hypothetical protein
MGQHAHRDEVDAGFGPVWLTSELFSKKIQPRLSNTATSDIRSSIGVSRWYASQIRQGYLPHPRHWEALAGLVGVSPDGQCIMKERPTFRRSQPDEAPPPLGYPVQGFAPLRRRSRVTAVVCPVEKDYRRA